MSELANCSVFSRVGRTAAEHGIRVTTLYTDPDSRAQHALSSPFAYNLGSVSAYLDGDRIIEIAKKEGCRGIHPGYGFVSAPQLGGSEDYWAVLQTSVILGQNH